LNLYNGGQSASHVAVLAETNTMMTKTPATSVVSALTWQLSSSRRFWSPTYTYVELVTGILVYLAVVIDAYDRAAIGWPAASVTATRFVTSAIGQADLPASTVFTWARAFKRPVASLDRTHVHGTPSHRIVSHRCAFSPPKTISGRD
jgi:hypothetical protein